ncbi:hypothetical protein E4N62_18675 [Streptomyces sp. MNU76]|uniref:hypothetical protein n=1 Tax=Streptomyces sp. MNU76 TaxID=2560026 RepID=UPI001E32AFAC|nr:hypothetical protein [Streptomyces sp. MNU76]MCC9707117.1 hypothetical protein [Streptomyces sp. MNU76]
MTSHPTSAEITLGTRILVDALGIDNPIALIDRHPEDTIPGVLAPLVAHAALLVDQLDQRLVEAAATAIEYLRHVADGQDPHAVVGNGTLNATGPTIDVLAARRRQEIGHLERLLNVYQRHLNGSDGHSHAPKHAAALTSQQTARSAAGPIRVSPAQVKALEAVARGGVMLRESSLARGTFVTSPNGARISRTTVDALLSKKLADQDTSTSLYQGQRLSLTAQGETVLAEWHRRASPRAEAARARTTAPAIPTAFAATNPEAQPAAAPAHRRCR